MKHLLGLACACLAALGLPGCDRVALQELRPGASTAREVRERMGPPNQEWRNEDGSVTWEYSRQPEGTECFMATIGPDQILRGIEQVLNQATFDRVQPGMTQTEVLRLLGRPARSEHFERKQERLWSWLIDRRMPGQKIYFTVRFDDGGRVIGSGPYTEQTQ